jgi:hypothetical protein
MKACPRIKPVDVIMAARCTLVSSSSYRVGGKPRNRSKFKSEVSGVRPGPSVVRGGGGKRPRRPRF